MTHWQLQIESFLPTSKATQTLYVIYMCMFLCIYINIYIISISLLSTR